MSAGRIPHRRLVLGLALAIVVGPGLASAACDPPRVLFVCPAGTVKSAIAREMLRRRARERGVAIEVRSRGLHLANHVSPGLARNLAADGIDPAAETAQVFQPGDLDGVDVLVAFDEAADLPALKGARNWATPSWNDAYVAAKAATAGRIEALIDELTARGCPSVGT